MFSPLIARCLLHAPRAPAVVSSWDPTSATGVTLKGWYENDATKVFTDLGSTLATNGQHVQQWNDKSGLGSHLNDNGNGSSLFPTWNTTGNGNLSWDGDDTLLTGTKTWNDGSGQVCMAFAGAIANVSGTVGVMTLDGSSQNLWLRIVSGVPTATSFDTTGATTSATGGAITNSQNVRIIVTVSTTSLQVIVNGVAGTAASLSGTRRSANTELYFGSVVGASRFPAGSTAVGGVIYAGVPGSSDLTALDTYLAARF